VRACAHTHTHTPGLLLRITSPEEVQVELPKISLPLPRRGSVPEGVSLPFRPLIVMREPSSREAREANTCQVWILGLF